MFLDVVVPSPSCPLLFSPHAQTVPLLLTASAYFSPGPMATTPVKYPVGSEGSTTWTGLFLCAPAPQVPMPSCPSKFLPHVQTVPSFLRATENSLPDAMAMTLLSPAAWTGVF